MVKHERNGYLLPAGDTPAMAEHAIKLLRDPELLGKMKRSCINRAKRHFTSQKQFPEYVKLYRDVITKRRKGR